MFDPTPCPTLDQVVNAFKAEGGEVFLGQDAYRHIGETAGDAQAEFLRRYVAEPLRGYEDAIPDVEGARALADLRLSATLNHVTLDVEGFAPYVLPRDADPATVLDDLEVVEEDE